MADSPPRFVFLLALNGRSGTNYLLNLISHHSDIAFARAPFWEDFLLHEAHHLKAFADGVFGHWSRVAGASATTALKQDLEETLGHSVCRFLSRGIDKPFVVLKTPSIQNLQIFYRFFPQEKLIILLRDGRDVVASGMRSFGWTMETASTAWARAADELRTFCQQEAEDRRLITRFEDLARDPKSALVKIFNYIGVDPELYDWSDDAISRVIGSSNLRQDGGDMHWMPVDKDRHFNPIGRWQDWSDAQRRMFDERAGQQLEALRHLV